MASSGVNTASSGVVPSDEKKPLNEKQRMQVEEAVFNPIPVWNSNTDAAKIKRGERDYKLKMKQAIDDFKKTSQVRMLFFMDCTGSMACYMEQAKDNINKVMGYVKGFLGK